ncbi:hypothetical protein BpHYR1_020653 [Brachionus plicatilis]|uniref:Uncharacterized protein n=1 Tax=Brachionus plicatilis TaxID=10195 RepID=A0A3M7SLD4_BRAPC|nr:hypothetical protein BpHYR1_020653 [Brachionus plicatilis]
MLKNSKQSSSSKWKINDIRLRRRNLCRFRSKREDFSWGSCKALIRQICNESRRDEKRNNTFKSIHQHDSSNSEEQSLSSSDTDE